MGVCGHGEDRLQLGHQDVTGGRRGEAPHEGVRQVADQEAHLEQPHHHLGGGGGVGMRDPVFNFKIKVVFGKVSSFTRISKLGSIKSTSYSIIKWYHLINQRYLIVY